MVKLSTVVLAVTSALPALTAAKACAEGLDYCGWNLVRRGRYIADILFYSLRLSSDLGPLRTLLRRDGSREPKEWPKGRSGIRVFYLVSLRE